jgi:hypothetical protein
MSKIFTKANIKLMAIGLLVICLTWFIGRTINLSLDLALAEARYQKQIAGLNNTIGDMTNVIGNLKLQNAYDSSAWIDKINLLDGKYMSEMDKIRVKSNKDLRASNATTEEVLIEKEKVEEQFTLCKNEVSELKLSIIEREKQFAKSLKDLDDAWQKKYDAMDTKYKICEDFRVKLEKKLAGSARPFWGVVKMVAVAGAGFAIGRL